jgi:hypothetical protein
MLHETSCAQLGAYIFYTASWICAFFAAMAWWQSANPPPQLARDMTDQDIAVFNETLKRSAAENQKAARLAFVSAALIAPALFMTFIWQPIDWEGIRQVVSKCFHLMHT